jgi:hypothetical protein
MNGLGKIRSRSRSGSGCRRRVEVAVGSVLRLRAAGGATLDVSMTDRPFTDRETDRPIWRWAAAAAAAAFGVATVIAGGRVLFGGESARAAAGAYVPFVVAFNFAAGFAYVAAAAGLALRKRWTPRLAVAIAAATVLVFVAFGVRGDRRRVREQNRRSHDDPLGFWIAFAAAASRLVRAR